MPIKLTIKKLLVFFHNILLQLCFFFRLRALYLSAFPSNQIGKGVAIHNRVFLFDFDKLSIGDFSTINNGCYIDNRNGVKIGSNVNISHDCKIYSMGHDINDPFALVNGGEVIIEDNVWVFPNSLIMPGIKIERGAVVYPGSVVTKDVGKYQIVGGNPAKYIKMRNDKIQYKLDNRVWFAK